MANTNVLCDTCTEIPFDAKDPPFGKKNPSIRTLFLEWKIGRLDRIRKRTNCPLCRIVVASMFDKHRGFGTYPEPDQEVTLQWFRSSGPAGAFEIIKGRSGTGICLVNEATHPSSVSPVRTFLTTSESQLDLKRVRRWMSVCEHDHGKYCNPLWSQMSSSESIIPGLEVLRLIDVVNGCLIECRSPCNYLALSYVWGGVPNFRLTASNKSILMQSGTLKKIWMKLPRTIQDAIDLVRALKESFLWVDALCLVQNDGVDLKKGVDVMDMIYERATMTIVAASGDSADAGLPGVREGSRFITQHTEQIMPDFKLAVYNDLDHLLRPSTYNRRAWTFQEQLLSRRALFFVDSQVYFRCRESTWSENSVDLFSKPNNYRFSASLLQLAWQFEQPNADYRILLLYYTQRALTNQSDALRAMTGIIRRLSEKMKCGFFQGVPTASFDSFMFFTLGNLSSLRRRQGFPSYSWIGWIGAINFPVAFDVSEENNWLFQKTWMVWYKRSPSGAVNLVWDLSANELFPTNDMKYVGYRRRSSFPNRHMLGFSTSRTVPIEARSFDRPIPSYPLLQFWTLAVYYTISDLQALSGIAYLSDNQQVLCGSIQIDDYEESTFFEREGTFEFIVISESSWDIVSLPLEDFDYPNHSNSDDWKYYNVLLLEWSEGISERRGVGIIFQMAVEKSFLPGPVWKEILMA